MKRFTFRLFQSKCPSPLVLVFMIAASASVFAQGTMDLCRETEKGLKHYQRLRRENETMLAIHNNEKDYRTLLSALRKAIAEGYIVSQFEKLVSDTQLGNDDPGQAKLNERLQFQKRVRVEFERILQAAIARSNNEFKENQLMLSDMVERYEERMSELDCYKVLQNTALKCGLGKTWDEVESEVWKSIWTSEGAGNIFTAQYTGPNGEKASTRNQVGLNGNQIVIFRLSSTDSYLCEYKGTIQPDGISIIGTYKCPASWSGERKWNATIKCN
jgi:hypothetical protein